MSDINAYSAGLADDIKAWDERIALELAQLLINLDGLPLPAQARDAVLGLLASLMTEAGHPDITTTFYESSRRSATDRRWPSAQRLLSEYGNDWTLVLGAAEKIAFSSPRGISTSSRHYAPKRLSYERADLLRPIIRCRNTIGRWPGHAAYIRWTRIARAHERAKSTANQQWVPSLTTISKYFDGWDRAIAEAKAHLAAEEKARNEPAHSTDDEPRRRKSKSNARATKRKRRASRT